MQQACNCGPKAFPLKTKKFSTNLHAKPNQTAVEKQKLSKIMKKKIQKIQRNFSRFLVLKSEHDAFVW